MTSGFAPWWYIAGGLEGWVLSVFLLLCRSARLETASDRGTFHGNSLIGRRPIYRCRSWRAACSHVVDAITAERVVSKCHVCGTTRKARLQRFNPLLGRHGHGRCVTATHRSFGRRDDAVRGRDRRSKRRRAHVLRCYWQRVTSWR